ncbi:MAG: YceI family protein [Bacteroidia bacterium]
MNNTATSVKGTWGIDNTHTEIGFSARHLVVTNVKGKFEKYEVSVEAVNDDFTDANISFNADVNSISTGVEQRDGHLKSGDFFNAEEFPKITFVSSSVKKLNNDEYTVTGDLTIRDVTKKIELKADYNGTIVDPWGGTRTGFELNGKISRKDFNLKWNALTEAGGAVVSDEIKLHINAELTKQAKNN